MSPRASRSLCLGFSWALPLQTGCSPFAGLADLTGGVMHGFKGERVLMRIHIGEKDRFDGKPLYRQIVELLRSRHYAGATVQRGIMGFGASSHLHTDRFIELSTDLPIVIECIETEEK